MKQKLPSTKEFEDETLSNRLKVAHEYDFKSHLKIGSFFDLFLKGDFISSFAWITHIENSKSIEFKYVDKNG